MLICNPLLLCILYFILISSIVSCIFKFYNNILGMTLVYLYFIIILFLNVFCILWLCNLCGFIECQIKLIFKFREYLD